LCVQKFRDKSAARDFCQSPPPLNLEMIEME